MNNMETGYYAQAKKIALDNCIGISRGKNRWIKIPHYYQALAPSYDLIINLKNTGDETAYIKDYNQMLRQLNAQQVWDDLHAITDNPVILCYEKSSDFCHRHLVAEWLTKQLGVEIGEFGMSEVVSRHNGRIVDF